MNSSLPSSSPARPNDHFHTSTAPTMRNSTPAPRQPRSPLAVAWHLLAFASLTWSFRYLYTPGPMTDFMGSSFGGRWQYLTILSLGVTHLVFLLSLLHDLYPLPLLARLKTTLAVLIVPVEGLVGLLYWGMTLYDPTLLVPEGAEFQLPFAVDVSIHGLPALYLWVDFLLFSPRFPKSVRPNLIAVGSTLAYVSWMEYTASRNGYFPYPFLNGTSPLIRSLVYVVQIPTLIGLYKAANAVHDALRGSSSGKKQADVAKRVEGKVGKEL